jgi:hypothetical protein
VRRARASRAALAAAAALALSALAAGSAPASEYSRGLAHNIERQVVYVDPKATPRVSDAAAGRIRLEIVKKDIGRVKIALVPESRAQQEGSVAALANAVDADLDFRGTLLVVAGSHAQAITSHPASAETATAVKQAFDRHNGDTAKQLLAAVDGIAAVDPGPSADLQTSGGSPPGAPDVTDGTKGIFDSVNNAIQVTTIIIVLSFLLPILAIALFIMLRIRRNRRNAAGDLDFEQEGLRNELVALGDDIAALDVDSEMPGANKLGLADYDAAVEQYDRANTALERSEQNPRYVAEARAALAEGKRRMSDAKVRLGVTPIP